MLGITGIGKRAQSRAQSTLRYLLARALHPKTTTVLAFNITSQDSKVSPQFLLSGIASFTFPDSVLAGFNGSLMLGSRSECLSPYLIDALKNDFSKEQEGAYRGHVFTGLIPETFPAEQAPTHEGSLPDLNAMGFQTIKSFSYGNAEESKRVNNSLVSCNNLTHAAPFDNLIKDLMTHLRTHFPNFIADYNSLHDFVQDRELKLDARFGVPFASPKSST